ncbi:MAG: terpene cyclase/mutase family protein [Lentisphaerales bacterium]|nr:terpene cyclase/mutase family protein [Lentisphaerales bacterium]
MSEVFEDEFHEEGDIEISENSLLEIQEEYRRCRLIESLVGPVSSTVFHMALIIILAFLFKDKYKAEAHEIEVQLAEVEEVKIEDPPPIEEPVLDEIEPTDATEPVLTTVTIETAETNDAALEDVNDEPPSTDDDSAVDAVSDIVVSPSAFASPTVFGGRSAGGRASAVSKFGGSKVGQEKLLKALYWLKKVQNPDGSWAENGGFKQAMTGLALLTFLAHGETQTSKEFGVTVRKAMEWLANSRLNTGSSHAYPHAIKAYALAEAYAMSGVSILEDAMNKSIRVIIDGQNAKGSYDYNYKKSDRSDLSFAGWNYQALKAAYGAGCAEEGLAQAISKSVEWLKVQGGSNDDGNGFPYAIKNGAASKKGKHTMRAVGVLCLQLFGEGQTSEIRDEIETIATTDLENLSWAKGIKGSLYGWYYATQCMFQKGGTKWKAWNRKFQKELGNNQNPEGYWEYPKGRGSGPGANPQSLDGRIYATTLCALMLTVYYRYLPSTKGAIGGKATKKKPQVTLEEDEGLNLID